jgi:hypothetical protein
MMIAATVLPSSARASCAGLIDTTTAMVGGKQYNPFSATSVTDNYTVRISNNGAKACNFALVFSAEPGPRQLGGVLSYTLTDPNGRPLLVPEPSATPPVSSLTATAVEASAAAQLSFSVNIKRGQFASPGRYNDDIMLHLYSVEGGQYRLQNSKPLSLAYTVPQALTVNMGRGEPGGTIQFGELMQGAQKTVSIRALSNVSYRFNVSSDNKGALLLDPPVAGQVWSVPYTVAVNNFMVALNAQAGSKTVLAPPSPIAGDNHALTVTIGDASKKRAGLYRDVITVEIYAGQP